MIHAQNAFLIPITPPGAIVDDASFVTATIDTAGFRYCSIFVQLGATDVAMAALKVREADAEELTGAEDVTGLVFGTSENTDGDVSSLPDAGDDSKLFVFEIDLRNRKRYLDLVATAGNGSQGTYMSAWALLTRAEENLLGAANRGIDQILRA